MNARDQRDHAREEHRGLAVSLEPGVGPFDLVRPEEEVSAPAVDERPSAGVAGPVRQPRADHAARPVPPGHHPEQAELGAGVVQRRRANPALASAPPNSITTSLGIGMHADSNSISTKMAT